jgi:microcin C transport system ATP-binding protein
VALCRRSTRLLPLRVEADQAAGVGPRLERAQIVGGFADPYGLRRGSRWPRLSRKAASQVHRLAADAAERRYLIEAALEEVGLPPRPQSATRTNSLAPAPAHRHRPRVVVLKPCFLALDEPTSALDLSEQAQIVEQLREL